MEDAFIKLSSMDAPSGCSFPRKRLYYKGITIIIIISIQQQIKITRLITNNLLPSLSTQAMGYASRSSWDVLIYFAIGLYHKPQ